MNTAIKLAGATVAGLATCTFAFAGAASASDDATTTAPVTVSQTPAEASAIDWAEQRMGATDWDGLCLRMVTDAYANAGVDVRAQAADNYSAVNFWNSTTDTKYPDGASSPAGSLIFWGASSAAYPDGHVAISLGNGQAISSDERDNVGIHIFSVAARGAQGYPELGYIIPG